MLETRAETSRKLKMAQMMRYTGFYTLHDFIFCILTQNAEEVDDEIDVDDDDYLVDHYASDNDDGGGGGDDGDGEATF